MLIIFFQAEDGIRDDLVTGVQTCALPISLLPFPLHTVLLLHSEVGLGRPARGALLRLRWQNSWQERTCAMRRSEERRVGKECRCWWSPEHYNKIQEIQ